MFSLPQHRSHLLQDLHASVLSFWCPVSAASSQNSTWMIFTSWGDTVEHSSGSQCTATACSLLCCCVMPGLAVHIIYATLPRCQDSCLATWPFTQHQVRGVVDRKGLSACLKSSFAHYKSLIAIVPFPERKIHLCAVFFAPFLSVQALFIFFILSITMKWKFTYSGDGYICVPCSVCSSQRTTFESWFSSSIMWVPEISLARLGLS